MSPTKATRQAQQCKCNCEQNEGSKERLHRRFRSNQFLYWKPAIANVFHERPSPCVSPANSSSVCSISVSYLYRWGFNTLRTACAQALLQSQYRMKTSKVNEYAGTLLPVSQKQTACFVRSIPGRSSHNAAANASCVIPCWSLLVLVILEILSATCTPCTCFLLLYKFLVSMSSGFTKLDYISYN